MNYTKQTLREIAMISAIISDEIMQDLYGKINYYFATAELIAEWSIEFYEKTQHIDWEVQLQGNVLSYKEDCNTIWNLDGVCWDDYIIAFAKKKLENY